MLYTHVHDFQKNRTLLNFTRHGYRVSKKFGKIGLQMGVRNSSMSVRIWSIYCVVKSMFSAKENSQKLRSKAKSVHEMFMIPTVKTKEKGAFFCFANHVID